MRKVLVTLLAAIFLLGCYLPVYAADVDMYGSARMTTFWTDSSEEITGDDSETQLNHTLQGNARIGAHFDSGPIAGRFEYGASGGNANIRHLYAEFDAGPGRILVGQTFTPYGLGNFISNQVYGSDADLLQFIGYTGREPMLRYSQGNFSIALIEVVEADLYDPITSDPDLEYVDGNPEITLPKVAARYTLGLTEGFSLDMSGIVQTYKLQDIDDETLTAWGLSASARVTQLDPLYVSLGGFYGQNVVHFGQWTITDSMALTNGVDAIEDTNSYGMILVLGTQLDTIGLEAGVGYAASENDVWDKDDEAMAYYAQATVPIMDNAKITPEVGFYDYKEDSAGVDEGDELYFGCQVRVDF
ncbi:MAG: hypothetical protein K9J85_11810 [Desulfobacteraceae bacterium]|nr:hypothetical protein [Desulfobacteraceae bacterium]